MTHIAVIGAGQLGVTFCLLLDQWRQSRPATQHIYVTLIDQAPEILRGATRASWIDHATGFEYFKRNEVKTGQACIQGSIVKRLLLPQGLHDMPIPIRNRFFVSTESNKEKKVEFEMFRKEVERVREEYEKFYARAISQNSEAGKLLVLPKKFSSDLPSDQYKGVSEEAVVGGVTSAGGIANMAMDFGFKNAALQRAMKRGTVRNWIPSASNIEIKESDSNVVITYVQEAGVHTFKADCAITCAAHGNSNFAARLPGVDLRGAYHLNFMLHAYLPPTPDAVLRDKLASVNFVLQGEHGGMYACVVPPTDREAGLAAMFAPGYDASYIDEYRANRDNVPPMKWEEIIREARFPGRIPKVEGVLARIYRLNPFLRDYLKSVPLDLHRVVVGSVFNPHGEQRAMRRLVPPKPLTSPKSRVLAMTSPKWTTAELAALTLLQYVLRGSMPEAVLPKIKDKERRRDGFGPYKLDILSAIPELTIERLRFDRSAAEKYLDSLNLPRRILPSTHALFL